MHGCRVIWKTVQWLWAVCFFYRSAAWYRCLYRNIRWCSRPGFSWGSGLGSLMRKQSAFLVNIMKAGKKRRCSDTADRRRCWEARLWRWLLENWCWSGGIWHFGCTRSDLWLYFCILYGFRGIWRWDRVRAHRVQGQRKKVWKRRQMERENAGKKKSCPLLMHCLRDLSSASTVPIPCVSRCWFWRRNLERSRKPASFSRSWCWWE